MSREIGRTFSKNFIFIIPIFVLVVMGVFFALKFFAPDHNQREPEPETVVADEPAEPAVVIPEFLDLQPVVDAWLAEISSASVDAGVVIYDLDNDRLAASYQPNAVFNAASIYKLFFVYDGYSRVDAGLADGDEFYVRTYDYNAGSYTFAQCLDLMIRESYNGCADPMRADAAMYARAEALISRLGLAHTSSAGLYSSAADLAELLKLYYAHPDLSEASWVAIQDSMLNQPKTSYEWRQGLPSGFSDAALVYDKVGWSYGSNSWDVYDDAAIVVFPEQNRHYIVVVMTEGLRSSKSVARLGELLEAAVVSDIALNDEAAASAE